MNPGATFKREMDIAFSEENDRFLLIYLDDITIDYIGDQDHLNNL